MKGICICMHADIHFSQPVMKGPLSLESRSEDGLKPFINCKQKGFVKGDIWLVGWEWV